MASSNKVKPEAVKTILCLTFSLLGNIGHFMLGLATLIALLQASGVLERVLEIKTVVEQIKTGVEELRKQILLRLMILTNELKYFKARFLQVTRIFYVPDDKYEEAIEILKNDDLKAQNSFLSKNLKIWNKE